MKRSLITTSITLALALTGTHAAMAQQFDQFFLDKTLRFDFYHAGNANSEQYYFDKLIEEPYWGGSTTSLIDNTGYGQQMVKIFDKASGTEIYSKSYCTLFNEWQTAPEAATGILKAMPESVVLPYPKAPIRLEIHARNAKGVFEKKYTQDIDPNHYAIRRFHPKYESFEVCYGGHPSKKIDIVLLPEGFSQSERAIFEKDCRDFMEAFFSYEPYKSRKSDFSIRAVWVPSADSGVSIPGEHLWRDTATKAQFYTFDSERYQMIEDFQNVRDMAAHVPYDYIYVLSNTQKYGGGAIYNFYGISAAHHPDRSAKVYSHEFGHLFLGLADEYYHNDSYEDIYHKDVEPWEENITTLVNLKSKDWYNLIPEGTPIPTPTADDADKHPEVGPVGVYEGGGYTLKGVYRPGPNCMMNNLHFTDEYCDVCKSAILKQINNLTK